MVSAAVPTNSMSAAVPTKSMSAVVPNTVPAMVPALVINVMSITWAQYHLGIRATMVMSISRKRRIWTEQEKGQQK